MNRICYKNIDEITAKLGLPLWGWWKKKKKEDLLRNVIIPREGKIPKRNHLKRKKLSVEEEEQNGDKLL